MGDVTRIEWTDHTFNPWWGCARVSPGCRFCYADRDAQRYGHKLWRRHGDRRMLSDANWAKPIKWNRDAERTGVPAKVFCASMADVFEDHPQVAEPRKRLWGLIESTPSLIWQLLTKRPENVAAMVPWAGRWPSNIWLGTSVEDQRRADERVPILLDTLGPSVRFLSCEPLLGPVDLDNCGGYQAVITPHDAATSRRLGYPDLTHIDWVICGGESGPKARPMATEWARALRDQCIAAGVPFLFKQWGEHYDGVRLGKREAGRILDGRTWDEYPQAVSA